MIVVGDTLSCVYEVVLRPVLPLLVTGHDTVPANSVRVYCSVEECAGIAKVFEKRP